MGPRDGLDRCGKSRPPQEAGWAPGTVWTDAENLAPPPGFEPRTVQPRSESLHRLSYSGPRLLYDMTEIFLKKGNDRKVPIQKPKSNTEM